MSRTWRFLFYWLPVFVWMVVIFGGSGDTGSWQHSSRIVEPLMHWLFPHASQETVDTAVFIARKCAHLTEYALLALLAWRARGAAFAKSGAKWHWNRVWEALWVAAFYATTDEFHQTFVPTREGCVRDVMIDSSGAFLGLLALYGLYRLRQSWWPPAKAIHLQAA